jgi:hypothetical protein
MGAFVPKGGVFDGAGVAYEPYGMDYWGAGRRAVPPYPQPGPALPMAIRARRLGFQGLGVYPGPPPMIGPGSQVGPPMTAMPPKPIAPAPPVNEAARRQELIGRGGTLFTPVFPCPVTRAPLMEHTTGERGGIFDSPNVPCDFDVAAQRGVPEAIRTLPLPSGATAVRAVPEAGAAPMRILPEGNQIYQKTFTIGPAMPALSPPTAPTGVRLLPTAGFGSGPDGTGCCG